ncbi:MAG: TraX family protein [Bacilli bacterium]
MREKSQVLSEFWLKVIAIVTMTMDHVGAFMLTSSYSAYFPEGSAGFTIALFLRGFGRLSFPLFALMLAEGLHKSHNREKYLLRLGGVWLGITVIELIFYFTPSFRSFAMAEAFSDLIMFALFIYFIEKKGWMKLLALLPLAYILVSYAASMSEKLALAGNFTSVWSSYFPVFLRTPYALYGFLLFLGFYYAYPLADVFVTKGMKLTADERAIYLASKEYRSLINLLSCTFLLVITVLFFAFAYLYPQADIYGLYSADPKAYSLQTYCLVDIVVIVMYNGKRGYDKKAFRYFEYAYYPLHLALLALIFSLIFQ